MWWHLPPRTVATTGRQRSGDEHQRSIVVRTRPRNRPGIQDSVRDKCKKTRVGSWPKRQLDWLAFDVVLTAPTTRPRIPELPFLDWPVGSFHSRRTPLWPPKLLLLSRGGRAFRPTGAVSFSHEVGRCSASSDTCRIGAAPQRRCHLVGETTWWSIRRSETHGNKPPL